MPRNRQFVVSLVGTNQSRESPKGQRDIDVLIDIVTMLGKLPSLASVGPGCQAREPWFDSQCPENLCIFIAKEAEWKLIHRLCPLLEYSRVKICAIMRCEFCLAATAAAAE